MGEPARDAQADGGRRRLSTRTLLGRYRDGRASALDALIAREVPGLRHWARGRLPRWARSLVDTADLIQDVLVRTLPRLDRFEPQHEKALQAYLRRAVENRMLDELRRVSHAPDLVPIAEESAPEPAAPGPSPLAVVIAAEEERLFSAALARLTRADQIAVVARLRLGYSYEQIAVVLDKRSANTARMVVTRAIERLVESIHDISASGRGG